MPPRTSPYARWLPVALAAGVVVAYWLFFAGWVSGADHVASDEPPSRTLMFYVGLGSVVAVVAAAFSLWWLIWRQQFEPDPMPSTEPPKWHPEYDPATPAEMAPQHPLPSYGSNPYYDDDLELRREYWPMLESVRRETQGTRYYVASADPDIEPEPPVGVAAVPQPHADPPPDDRVGNAVTEVIPAVRDEGAQTATVVDPERRDEDGLEGRADPVKFNEDELAGFGLAETATWQAGIEQGRRLERREREQREREQWDRGGEELL